MGKPKSTTLTRAQEQLRALAAGLETTTTLAEDLMKIRKLRLVIDNCKKKANDG